MREIKSQSDKIKQLGYSVITFFSGILLGGVMDSHQNIYIISYIGIVFGFIFIIYNKYTDHKWQKEIKEVFK